MADEGSVFAYEALAHGRRVSGRIEARSKDEAYERLRLNGLAPTRIRPVKHGPKGEGRGEHVRIPDRKLAEALSSLAVLLEAGADIRSALTLLMSRSAPRDVRSLCQALLEDVSGGGL